MQCRLRAHHRAPCRAAVGQGGHACELQECPHCSKQLVPGLPHVGCALGLAAPKQAAKRRRLLKTRQDDEQQVAASHCLNKLNKLNYGSMPHVQRRQPRMCAVLKYMHRPQRSLLNLASLVHETCVPPCSCPAWL